MIFIIAKTHASAQGIAHLGRLQRLQWTHLLHQEQLMGVEAPNVVIQDNLVRAELPAGMLEILDSRSARYWSEFDLEKGKITPWT